MNDEYRDHLTSSLCHIEFLRDFVIRTDLSEDQYNELTWYYGRDWNGGFDDVIYDSQLDAMLSILEPGVQGSVTIASLDDDEGWENIILLESDVPIDLDNLRESAMFELMYSITFMGDKEDLSKWQHFIRWMKPDALLVRDKSSEQTNFSWLVDALDMSTILDAWETILGAWEVMEYYEHCSRADRWRELRGRDNLPDESEPATAA